MSDLEQVGTIGVDAGLCWIGDPCYCVTPDGTEHPAETWPKFCEQMDNESAKQFDFKAGHTGVGVCVTTGYGDGVYPVLIKRNKEGCVKEVRVVFIEDEED